MKKKKIFMENKRHQGIGYIEKNTQRKKKRFRERKRGCS